MRCKYCKKNGFLNKKGLSSHRELNNRDNLCFKTWKQEQEKEDKNKTKVKCKICKEERFS